MIFNKKIIQPNPTTNQKNELKRNNLMILNRIKCPFIRTINKIKAVYL